MIIFRGRVSFPKFDSKKYTEALDKQVQVQMRQAAREWLRAVIPKVPVWTGTAKGSLIPLGRFVNRAVERDIHPVAVRPGMGPRHGENKAPKNETFYFRKEKNRHIFRFKTSVFHFIQNEFYHAPKPPFNLRNQTPWHAITAGKAAFDDYVANRMPNVKSMVKLKDYIKFESKRIGP